jgi:hypothetical protein
VEGKDGVHRSDGLAGELRQRALTAQELFCGHDTDAVGVGHNGQPRSPGAVAGVQGARGVEEILRLADPDDAQAAEYRIVDFFRPGHRARVGEAGAVALLQFRGFEEDDGLVAGEPADGADEELHIADDLFHVEDDALRVGVLGEEIDDVPEIHVDGRPQGDDRAEADVGAEPPVEKSPAEVPHVGDEGDISPLRIILEEGGVEPHGRAHDPQAVGTDDPHAVAVSLIDPDDIFLQAPPLWTRFPKPGGDDDESFHSGPAAGVDDPRHGCGGGYDDGQIDRSGYGADVGPAGASQDRIPVRIYGIDRPIARRQGVFQNRPSERPLLIRGADDGDRRRIEELLQITHAITLLRIRICTCEYDKRRRQAPAFTQGGAIVPSRIRECNHFLGSRFSDRAPRAGSGGE